MLGMSQSTWRICGGFTKIMLIKYIKYYKIPTILIISVQILLFVDSSKLYCQEPVFSFGPWMFQSVNGSLMIQGLLRNQFYQQNNGFEDTQNTKIFMGNIKLNTNSYIWHPNFIKISLEGEYSPNSYTNHYIVTPNVSETNTLKRITANVNLFSKTDLNINGFANLNDNVINRDMANDINIKNQSYGLGLGYNNIVLPISLNYFNSKTKEIQLSNNTEYNYSNSTYNFQTTRELFGFSRNSINITHDDISTSYSNYDYKYKVTSANMSNQLDLGDNSNNYFNSYVGYNDMTGFQRNKKFDLNQNLLLKLPEDFKFRANFSYNNNKIDSITNKLFSPSINIEHQLFLSLRSYGYYQYSKTESYSFDESRNTFGVGINYQKTIPTGKLFINYEFRNINLISNSNPHPMIIKNEVHTIDDSKKLLLTYPYINPVSIVVRNTDLTQIYELNIDYVVITQGNYIEIKRLPGGKITNLDKISIDYISDVTRNLNYNSRTNNFEIRLSMLDKFMELYFKFIENKYHNSRVDSTFIINPINQKVTGIALNIGELTVGGELDIFYSNILPYTSYRLFGTYNGELLNDVFVNLTGNLNRYTYSDLSINNKQTMFDVSSRILYNISSKIRLAINLQQVLQQTSSYKLNSTNLKIEASAVFNWSVISGGFEMFNRAINKDKSNYSGLFLKIERKF